MRKIVFTLMGLTAALVMGDMGVCQKNCGIDFGKCLILQGNMELCLKQEAACALDCLKSLTVEGHKHGSNHRHHTPAVKKVTEYSCIMECGNENEKCIVQNWDKVACIRQNRAC